MWEHILGQEQARQALRHDLAAGQVAQAYLLAGPDGVGKRRLAMALTKALVCVGESDRPCDTCRACQQATRGSHPDVRVVESDGSSLFIKIETVREVLARVALRPFSAPTQVVIIDPAERLTEEAANSLLKSLEEPAATTRFVLITSRVSDCLPTLVSRCRLIRCQRLRPATIAAIMQPAAAHASPEVVERIARLARGSAARALELAAHWSDDESMVNELAARPEWLWVDQPLPENRDQLAGRLDGLMSWLRDVAVTAVGGTQAVAHMGYQTALEAQAQRINLEQCVQAVFAMAALRESLDRFANPRLVAAAARERWLAVYDQ